MTCNHVRHTEKMSEMEVSKRETCLWKIKYCGSSTVTIHKQKLWLLCAVYIYYKSCTTPLSQASPVFDLPFYLSATPFYTIVYCGISACSCMWCWLPRPDSVLYNGACKYLVCEIEVIMRVRVRQCRNACVSHRMRESWQLCQCHFIILIQ